jgi:hypothetical protein
MAFKTGVATNHTAFFNTLITFLTTELPVAERHIILRNVTNVVTTGVTREVILRAPGLSGVNYFYLGFRLNVRPDLDVFNMELSSFTGYISSNTYETQPGIGTVGMNLWNQATPYWLSANGRYVNTVVRVSTHYFTNTVQLPLTWGIPTSGQYFPILGGSIPGGLNTTRYSVTTIVNWFDNLAGGVTYIRNLAGTWTAAQPVPYAVNASIPLYRNLPNPLDSNISEGTYTLKPIIIVVAAENNVYGQLNNFFFISGFNNTAENIITGTDGLTYIIFPDNMRSGFNEFIAMRMN